MKEEGRLEGPFEFGVKPVKQASKTDWDEVWEKAKAGRWDELSSHIKVTHYHKLKSIEKDHMVV